MKKNILIGLSLLTLGIGYVEASRLATKEIASLRTEIQLDDKLHPVKSKKQFVKCIHEFGSCFSHCCTHVHCLSGLIFHQF